MRRRRPRDCSPLVMFMCGFSAGLLCFAFFASNQLFLPFPTPSSSPKSVFSLKSRYPAFFHHENDGSEPAFDSPMSSNETNSAEQQQQQPHPMLISFRHQHDRPDSVAVWLRSRVRVLCWIATTAINTRSKALHINATWAPRCNKHVFVSAAPDSGLPSVDLKMANESRKTLWGKTKRAFRHFYETELDNFDWFLKADDDTYVIMENLRMMLAPHDPDKPWYFGCKFKPFVKQGYMSGGSGYVLSRETLRRFVEHGLTNGTKCRESDNGMEDVQMGICMEKLGVEAGDTRDSNGRHRMLPFSPLSHFESDRKLPKWFYQYMFYPYTQGDECCSDSMVSFHYVTRPLMYAIHNLVYHVRPFGLDRSFPARFLPNSSSPSALINALNSATKEGDN